MRDAAARGGKPPAAKKKKVTENAAAKRKVSGGRKVKSTCSRRSRRETVTSALCYMARFYAVGKYRWKAKYSMLIAEVLSKKSAGMSCTAVKI